MPNKYIQIPITDHGSTCTSYYLVEWKLSTDTGYNTMNWAVEPPIIINNVLDASTYNVRITRFCCDGSQSVPLTLNVDTSSNSPQLDQPLNLTLTPGTETINADCDDVANADEYVFQIADDDEFTVNMNEFIAAMSEYDFLNLISGGVYYVRVKARASGYQDSIWSDTETTTVP